MGLGGFYIILDFKGFEELSITSSLISLFSG